MNLVTNSPPAKGGVQEGVVFVLHCMTKEIWIATSESGLAMTEEGDFPKASA